MIHLLLFLAAPMLDSSTAFIPRIHFTCFVNVHYVHRGKVHQWHSTKKGEEKDEDGHVLPTKERQSSSQNNATTLQLVEPNQQDLKEIRKKQIGMVTRSLVNTDDDDNDNNSGLLDKLNPFQVGKKIRKSLDSAITSLARASGASGVSSQEGQRSIYYLDDRFQESGGALFSQEMNPYLSRLEKENYIPEVLVVGATGEVGRLVVRRLLLEGRCRCRCLVSDLYSRTLNMLGTGVVYCQGDLDNLDSLEYALTDVDKIVVCAEAPNNIEAKEFGKIADSQEINESDTAWERLEAVLDERAKMAEQVDYVGMQNLVRAYQNVRFADYGTSQAAKRSLFKFHSRAGDFVLFDIDHEDPSLIVHGTGKIGQPTISSDSLPPSLSRSSSSTFSMSSLSSEVQTDNPFDSNEHEDLDEYDYDDIDADYDDIINAPPDPESAPTIKQRWDEGAPPIKQRQDDSVTIQVNWIRNEFGHGVFVGRVPEATESAPGGDATLVSSRLRTRDSEDGLDFSVGFGGFICRLCADGGVYEAFIRNELYEKSGIEYVCEFNTGSKQPRRGNASRNKFVSVRLPFDSFKPTRRLSIAEDTSPEVMPAFEGHDVRYLGFRFRSSRNRNSAGRKKKKRGMTSFYIALSFIKLYRSQPEPEIVYLSDARIPPVVLDSQVRHDIRQIIALENVASALQDNSFQIYDDTVLKGMRGDKKMTTVANRIPEEVYFKYRGEQILKNSGLRYSCMGVLRLLQTTGPHICTRFCEAMPLSVYLDSTNHRAVRPARSS